MYTNLEAKTVLREAARDGAAIVASGATPAAKAKAFDALNASVREAKTRLELSRKTARLMVGGDSLHPGEAGPEAAYMDANVDRLGMRGLSIGSDAAHELFDAVQRKGLARVQLKAGSGFGFPDGTLPPTLLPGLVERRYEPVRVIDHLQSTSIGTPSVEFLTHESTTGAAAVTAAGDLKPEVSFTVTPQTLPVRKIAVYSRIQDEALRDFASFNAYLSTELIRMLTDAENAEVLSGDGTGVHLEGLLNASGILTHDHAADVTADPAATAFDSLEESVSELRTGAQFTEPDGLFIHPATWSKIRRTKDNYGRYLVQADPSTTEVRSIWGVPVLPTTSMPQGTALLGNFHEGAQAFIRQGFTLEIAPQNNDDFQRNLTSFRAEERLTVGVLRPASLLKVVGL